MVIDGVSQSTGIERLVEVAAAAAGVRVAIRDRKLGTELGCVTVPTDELMTVLTEQPTGSRTIGGDGRRSRSRCAATRCCSRSAGRMRPSAWTT